MSNVSIYFKNFIHSNEYTGLGVVTEFKWCLLIGEIFGGQKEASDLQTLTKGGSSGTLMPSAQALVFVDNHDNQRGHGAGGDTILTYKRKSHYVQAVAFTLATDYGIPRIMSSFNFNNSDQGPPADSLQAIDSPGFESDGSCSNGWICEHRWPEIKRMIQFRKYVQESTLDHIQASNVTFAFCRGTKGFIAFNNSPNPVTRTFHTCLHRGQYCDIISGEVSTQRICTGLVINVDTKGDATITLPPNSVIAIYRRSKL